VDYLLTLYDISYYVNQLNWR